jgi:hypothetical protein
MRLPCCLCVFVYPLTPKAGIMEAEDTGVARQRFDKYVPEATSTHATTEELLAVVFSMRSVWYQISGRKIRDYFPSLRRVRIPPR